ncbi:hypothetical protein QAD02_018147 [Eretmocerus hayati]|uniref:Uncharacterized protein n=1 Tax=Eretmocerus hayati TaxID=131215 RepID=A0ACC2PFZ8_9HYME|nr:hypothetical protein QAD02_018147 [Eretmocerus hayati]
MFLLESTLAEICGDELPTNKDVLRNLYHHTRDNNAPLSQAINTVIDSVLAIWKRSGFQTSSKYYCREKLKSYHYEYRNIQKCKDRSTCQKKIEDFSKGLGFRFDVAHRGTRSQTLKSQAVSVEQPLQSVDFPREIADIEDVPDRDTSTASALLEVSSISLEYTSTAPEESTTASTESIDPKNMRYNLRDRKQLQNSATGELAGGSYSQSSSGSNTDTKLSQQSNTSDYGMKKRYERRGLRGTKNIMTASLAAALDTVKLSFRNTVRVIAGFCDALHISMNDLIINRESFRRMREVMRTKSAEKIKDVFGDTELKAAILHWDGKKILNKSNRKVVERLSLVITDGNVSKIIDIPALDDGKGKTQAEAAYASLVSWGLVPHIKGFCCDTPPTNFGRKSGVAVLLEQMLERDVLFLACRHHVYEIILAHVFEIKIPGTVGPDVQLFKKLRSAWDSLDKKSFKLPERGEIHPSLLDQVDYLTSFFANFEEEQLPRDDYRQFVNLCSIFLGGIRGDDVKFSPPGAIHHARWMAKAIYCILMYLFRDSLDLTEQEKINLREVCFFIVFVYAEFWFKAPLSVSAANNDLTFLKKLKSYRQVDVAIADGALKKMSNHLWYLSPETVSMAFFDQTLPIETKERMVVALSYDPVKLIGLYIFRVNKLRTEKCLKGRKNLLNLALGSSQSSSDESLVKALDVAVICASPIASASKAADLWLATFFCIAVLTCRSCITDERERSHKC